LKSLICLLFGTILFFPLISKAQEKNNTEPTTVYKSARLIITQLSENEYVHTSFLNTESFGKVPCNGMIVQSKNEAIVFDTPTNDSSSAELISFIKNQLHSKIKAVIPTHFHEDCLGGLKEFNKNHIPSYALALTIELAKSHGYNVPTNKFEKELKLKVGDKIVYATFFGEGHTKDNIVGYVPADNIMFGGCLVKELNATKGYLDDANVEAWSGTVEKVKNKYPNVKIVVPGHGDYGDSSLLDYTIKLFRNK
jgi:metallo-beta-lactamase class B